MAARPVTDDAPARGRRLWLRGALYGGIGGLMLLSGCASVPRPDALITGRAFSLQRLYIPPDAVFEAVLLDVTNEGEAPVALGRQRLEPAGQAPFDLAIPFRKEQVQRNGKYVVQAQVTLYNELIFYTPGVNPVMQDPAFQRVDVMLEPYVRTDATVNAAIPFAQTHWRLLSVGENAVTPVAPAAEGAVPAFLQFQPAAGKFPAGESQGDFVGSGGCNRFLGTYRVQGKSLRLQLTRTSIRLCLDGGGDEPAFLSALAEARSFVQRGRELELQDEDDKPILQLRAQEGAWRGSSPMSRRTRRSDWVAGWFSFCSVLKKTSATKPPRPCSAER